MKPSAQPRAAAPSPESLEGRVASLEQQLEQVRQEMRSFSYSVSHDLRAPLRAIEGFSRILCDDFAKSLDAEGQRFLHQILANAQIMSGLIEDLLMYHRLNERTIAPEKVDMTQMVREVIAALPNISRTAPEVRLPQLPDVSVDPALFRTAWEHLISNALKFSKNQSQPIIEFGAAQQDDHVIIWVRDNGIGFDMKYADKLFQVFQKLHRDPEYPGNGIGLALVRRVAEKHNGRAWAEAAPNQGAKFSISIPM